MITIKAPAKINWFLLVAGKRADGYHEILSLIQCVSLFDTLSFSPGDGITLDSSADIPLEDNLVYRAANLLRERNGIKTGARIRLEKQIPVSAGLGGGSSDAAATLLGLNDLWGLGMGIEQLQEIGAELGSDVPFFISGGPSLVSGRGEVIEPLLKGPTCAIALLKPRAGVSAGFAYSGLREFRVDSPSKDGMRNMLGKCGLGDVIPLMQNDLETPVFRARPEVRELKEILLARGARAGLMSGSGSTVFGVFEEEAEAARAVDSIKSDQGKDLWSAVVSTI